MGDTTKPRWGGAPTDKCVGCSKTVYPAEKLLMQDKIWHIECLRCVECNKKLGGSNWGGYVGEEQKPYCAIHLKKLILTTGGGKDASQEWAERQAAGGGRQTSAPSPGQPRYGGGDTDKCTGCGKTVYMAEKLIMQEQIWHADCLKCVDCNKKLSGANWGGFVPPDNKAYCNVHHLKLVQAQGGATAFSGSTAQWTPKESKAPTSGAKPRFGGGEEETCEGCGKKAYLAEKMKMEGRTFHPTCLRCVSCNKMLSGSNWGGFVPPDSKPYCKIHLDQLISATGSATAISGSTGTWGSK